MSICVHTNIPYAILSPVPMPELLFSCYLLISVRTFIFREAACFLKAVGAVLGSRQSEKWFQFHLYLLSRETGNPEMSVQR